MKVVPMQGGCGAEVQGLDLKDLTGSEVDAIVAAQARHGVVFFHDQSMTPAEQLRVAQRFGDVNVNRFFTPVPSQPEVALVLKEPRHETNIGGGWHTDHSYDDIPALGSMLHAKEVPTSGGDTLFANMYLAAEGLSDGLRRTLMGMSAVHSSRHVFGSKGFYSRMEDDRYHNPELATQDAVHPVIVRHPVSGRAALYVNPGFTLRFDGWTLEESRPLLTYLYELGAREEHTCRFHWREGSVAFWDNRATWHHALNDYPGERRLMHRVTIEGEPLPAYSGA